MEAAIVLVAIFGFVILAIAGKTLANELSPTLPEDVSDNFSPNTDMTDIRNSVPEDENADNGNAGATPEWNITTDPNTWPAGDRVWDICRAIALAEGFNVPSAAPFLLNNPGDISDGSSTFGYEQHSGSKITKFPDAQTGWQWLYDKIKNHVTGRSSVYPRSLTVTQFSQKYAANWQPWKTIVGRQLNLNSDTQSFSDYVNS
jgi:hypothetical protein